MITISVIVLLTGTAFCAFAVANEEIKTGIIIVLISIIISAPLFIFGMKSNSFKRFKKDFKSNYSDGIDRTITITAEDGRLIYEYEGTIDIEIDEELRKIKFEDEDGKRQIIIYGVQDTVQIIEK